MEKYSEEDIAKIINDCEILILPENSSFEDVLTSEIENLFVESQQLSSKVIKTDEKLEPTLEPEESDEYFEEIYQNYKTTQNNGVTVSFY